MRYALTKTIATGQAAMIKRYGDITWNWLTDHYPEWFDIAAVTDCPALAHLALRTRTDIGRVIIANVEAEYRGAPDNCPFVRRGNAYYWRIR